MLSLVHHNMKRTAHQPWLRVPLRYATLHSHSDDLIPCLSSECICVSDRLFLRDGVMNQLLPASLGLPPCMPTTMELARSTRIRSTAAWPRGDFLFFFFFGPCVFLRMKSTKSRSLYERYRIRTRLFLHSPQNMLAVHQPFH